MMSQVPIRAAAAIAARCACRASSAIAASRAMSVASSIVACIRSINERSASSRGSSEDRSAFDHPVEAFVQPDQPADLGEVAVVADERRQIVGAQARRP
jgi:hypothetical protein